MSRGHLKRATVRGTSWSKRRGLMLASGASIASGRFMNCHGSMSAGPPMADGPWRIIVIGGPWPERIGQKGVTVPDGPDRYPWHKLPKGEQIILLDDDPLSSWQDSEPRWTCVMPIKHLAYESRIT